MGSLLTVVLDGLAYGMVMFIISAGLTVTMGLMRVVNLAHGGFAMMGGYMAAVLLAAGWPFLLAVAAAVVAVAAVGGVAERLVFRPLYRKGELPQVLMTFGLVFVIIAALTGLFGTGIQSLPLPAALAGEVDIGFRTYPRYRLFVIAAGLALGGGLWWLIDRSLFGARLRAAVDNPRMARAVGMDVNRLFTITFMGACGWRRWAGCSAPSCCRWSRSTRSSTWCCSWSSSPSAASATSRARSSPRWPSA
ncbi:branched-chain amino acid ABC transporter permease [Aquabacterium sp. J223]|uniref:branched-chain amino acid ABC transporter permease n=1 Tax=Aquabacterium sp. J223 TaxID=2898431 RepID=UPI0021AE05F3|nr:branched-chain amino acid ABC transporter permease [Aquabacterium sp. J223]UUX94513.1 branched-chain amino acid ABC transporter permease [Aquabacterium sp. J223]